MRAGSRWKRFRYRLRYWLDRSSRQRQLWEEMEFHIDSMAQELAGQGMPEAAARAAAHRKFGNMTQKSEEARATLIEHAWIARWIGDLTQDLCHAFRGMRRDAGFTAFTVLIAGLGIGASSTVFSVVNALLLRPLPFRDPGRLVWISNGADYATQTEHYADLRELNRSFDDLAGWSGYYRAGDKELTGMGEPERLTSVPVTGNLFAILGVPPAIGRGFTAEECLGKYSEPPAALMSYRFWRRRFGSDPDVVGRKLILNNKPVTVVGVLPESFDFGSVFAPGTSIDIFIPWPLKDQAKPRGNTMKLVGRLKPGATVRGAQAELTTLAKQLEGLHPERNGLNPQLVPLAQSVSGGVKPALYVLAWAVGIVMLIVCANLSNLQLARSGARQKEMTLRTALGAGRSRLLRQMLTESVWRWHVAARCWGWRWQWRARVSWRICRHSTFLCSKAFGPMGARWCLPYWLRWFRACSSACCRRYGSRNSPCAKGCRTQAGDRAAAGGTPGSATGWWFPNSPSPASCW